MVSHAQSVVHRIYFIFQKCHRALVALKWKLAVRISSFSKPKYYKLARLLAGIRATQLLTREFLKFTYIWDASRWRLSLISSAIFAGRGKMILLMRSCSIRWRDAAARYSTFIFFIEQLPLWNSVLIGVIYRCLSLLVDGYRRPSLFTFISCCFILRAVVCYSLILLVVVYSRRILCAVVEYRFILFAVVQRRNLIHRYVLLLNSIIV